MKSTGPKTSEGKATVSKNAIKHGLLSSETLLPWEDGSPLDDLVVRLRTSLSPQGEMEELLVDRIIALTWRLKRAGRIETAIFAWRRYALEFEAALAELRSHERQIDPSNLEGLLPAQILIKDGEAHDAARKTLHGASAVVNADLPALGRTFVGDTKAFDTLHRYESGMERSLFKALHELQRLQAGRQGKDVPPPIAVDVHGDGTGDCFF